MADMGIIIESAQMLAIEILKALCWVELSLFL
jgi:hypothetical protein